MKAKRMGITEILRMIWLFSANKIKSPESVSKQLTQLIVELKSSLLHIIVTQDVFIETIILIIKFLAMSQKPLFWPVYFHFFPL